MSKTAADNSLRPALLALMVTAALTACGQPTVVRHYTTQLFTRVPDTPSALVDPATAALEQVDSITYAVSEPKILTRSYGHVWGRLSDNFQLPEARDPRLDRQIAWYQRNANSLRGVLDRADPFMGWILDQLESQNLPAELALLPVIESGYQPLARSPGGAAGLWQFIPGTGNRFGLTESSLYNGRQDVVASTQAAIEYFTFLRDEFSGDWLLALAAYNCGEGTVARAVQRNRSRGLPEDFWHLDLPKVTQEYVPKLLALRNIVATPGHYGIKLPNLDAGSQIALVDPPDQINLRQAATIAGITLDDIRRLNPGLKPRATVPNGQLVIPADAAEKFAAGLADLDESESDSTLAQATPDALRSTAVAPVVSGQTYTVRSGDTLGTISRTHKISLQQLANLNDLLANEKLRVGQTLLLAAANSTVTADTTAAGGRQTLLYTVRSGDSLLQISRRYRVKVADLRWWNDLKSDQYLHPGQKLTLYLDTRLRADGSDS